VAIYDFVVRADQDRIAKSEPADACGDLPVLFFRVRASVTIICCQPVERNHFDLVAVG
jgi:hypothetical protein